MSEVQADVNPPRISVFMPAKSQGLPSKPGHSRWKVFALVTGIVLAIVAIAAILVLCGLVGGHHQNSSTSTSSGSGGASSVETDSAFSGRSVAYFELTITESYLAPDGFNRSVMLINGQLPGPTITLTKGQLVKVKVVNKMSVPTTLHWHGMFQRNTSFMDGASSISQCPIPAGRSFIYQFAVDQVGTYWYHSHYEGQYGNGIVGALIVKDPEAPFSFYEERVLVLNDWYHVPIEYLAVDFLSVKSDGAEPVPDSGLINGKGKFNCSYYSNQRCTQLSSDDLYSTEIVANRTYFFRIIGATAFSSYFFSIDGLTLKVVEVDGVYIQPYKTSTVVVTPGQRVGVLVRATKANKNLWMRALMDVNMFDGMNPVLDLEVHGILRVKASPKSSPRSSLPSSSSTLVMSDADDSYYKPLYGQVPKKADHSVYLEFVFQGNPFGVNAPTVNGVTFSPPSHPVIQSIVSNPNHQFEASSNVYRIPGGGKVVDIVLVNLDEGNHPFHLHGHTFWVIARATGTYNSSSVQVNLERPLERDTVLVPAGGFVVLRFIADNPGVWIFHCHIEWHMIAGLAVVFVEDAPYLAAHTKIPIANLQLCSSS